VLELSLLKFDSSVNDFSTGFADVRCDGEAFCKCWFERRCRAESHSEDGKCLIVLVLSSYDSCHSITATVRFRVQGLDWSKRLYKDYVHQPRIVAHTWTV